MMYYVYMLRCADGSLYTGITSDLEKRMKTHNSGKASHYTAARLPVQLAYTEEQPDKSSALKREYVLRNLTRAEKEHLLAK